MNENDPIGCNKKVNLQQICNEFGMDNAKLSASVHNRKNKKRSIIPDHA